MKLSLLVVTAALAVVPVWGQALDLNLSALAAKAKEKVEVKMDQALLKQIAPLAQSMVDGNLPKGLKVPLDQVRGISVNVFEFAEAGQYSNSDLDGVRRQVNGNGWARIINVQEEDEQVEIHMLTRAEKVDGLLVIVSEPKELVVVAIEGSVELDQLQALVESTVQYQMEAAAR